MVKLEKLVEGLRSVSDDDFTCGNINQYLIDNPVDIDSMAPYFVWSPEVTRATWSTRTNGSR